MTQSAKTFCEAKKSYLFYTIIS